MGLGMNHLVDGVSFDYSNHRVEWTPRLPSLTPRRKRHVPGTVGVKEA
jgi:hypothetical protein